MPDRSGDAIKSIGSLLDAAYFLDMKWWGIASELGLEAVYSLDPTNDINYEDRAGGAPVLSLAILYAEENRDRMTFVWFHKRPIETTLQLMSLGFVAPSDFRFPRGKEEIYASRMQQCVLEYKLSQGASNGQQ